MAELLHVDKLWAGYGEAVVLEDVSFSLNEGDSLSLLGRNGMGKTTLCKAIMGLVPVASGSISFHGQPLVGRSPADIARAGIGYVPQGRRLWRSLTVEEHLKMVERKGGAWTIERIFSTFPRIAERRGNGGAQLSGGEQQMLAIGRALMSRPRLLLLDEPTLHLDPHGRASVLALLRTLADGGRGVVVVTHEVDLAAELADHLWAVKDGRVHTLAPTQWRAEAWEQHLFEGADAR